MIQLRVLSSRQAGPVHVIRNFPCALGRSGSSDVRLEENGVWDRHAKIDLDSTEGCILKAEPETIVSVNGQRVQQARLRNGDIIELGSAKLQFWLNETAQKSLRAREVLTWVCLGAISLAQVWLIYWLLR